MSKFGNMLQEYFVNAFRENLKLRREELEKINSREKALEYISGIRAKIRSAFRFPAEKSPLSPRITGKLDLDGVVMEKIVISSRPDFNVTMNLFLPAEHTGKLPGVLILCGHSLAGKATPFYQAAARSLAKQGAAALIIDPIHQGERIQCPPEKDPGLCNYHNRLHRQLLASGDNFASWRTWDAIRAIDYLVSREEVDPHRIGVSGCSGGGTLTALVNACDDRITAAAPSCYITRWLSNVENELPVDGEQTLPGIAACGGEMADLLLAAAPRPILILGKEDDFFDIRGGVEVFNELGRIYELLSCKGRAGMFIASGQHGFCRSSRDRLYQFFASNIGTEYAEEEEDMPPIAKEDTFCFPGGIADGMTVLEAAGRQAAAAAAAREELSEEELRDKLSALLQLGETEVPHYRQLRHSFTGGKLFVRYALEPEKGIISVLKYMTEKEIFHIPFFPEVELYVPHQDAASEMAAAGNEGLPFFGIDYCGIGETMPEGCDQFEWMDFFSEYHFDYHFASISWLLGKSLIGMRTRDVLAAIALLKQNGTEKIRLTASGIGIIPALFAAFLSDSSVTFVPKDKDFIGFQENSTDFAAPIPQSMIPEGILTITDLHQISQMLKNR